MAINPGCDLIAILGGKGGVGKSVFAANFAAATMLELRTQVLLIDADAKSCGDQNWILNLRPNKTMGEVANYTGSLNPQAIPQLVTAHPSGLGFIGAVRGPEEVLRVNPELFMKQLEFLSRTYKYIIVDIGNELQPLQHAFLAEATAAIIVTVPEVLVINQTKRLIQDLAIATYPRDMFQLVVNKVGINGLAPQTIANDLRLQPVGNIPLDDVTTAGSLQRQTPFVLSNAKAPISIAYHEVVRRMTGGTLQRLKNLKKPQVGNAPTAANNAESGVTSMSEGLDPRTALKMRVHSELIKAIDLKKTMNDTQGDKAKEEDLRRKTQATITQIVDREAPGSPRDERSKIIKEVLEEALGLGPLEDLLANPDITEIMVNGHKRIFVEKLGKVTTSPVVFTSNMHLRNVIERIVTPLGRRIDEKNPYVDARLKDGSRVNAVIEPLSIDGPSLTIRKFRKGGITAEKYISYGSMNQAMVDFLKICIENKLNVVVSGGTGSGKTSLLNMLSGYIPAGDRVVTIEDAAELQLQQAHVVRLETRPANMEGTGAVTIRDLVRNSLRMRPDRIIVGETRDGAALDMLQAMNTGHDGSLTTTHANSPRECVARLQTLCLMAGMDLPAEAIKDQIASAVHIIVQIQRLSDGSRKVTSITEVCGMQGETITLQEIFRFKETGFDKNRKVTGLFQSTGMIPTFLEKLSQRGVNIPREMFSNDAKITTPATAAGKTLNMPGMMKKTGTGDRT